MQIDDKFIKNKILKKTFSPIVASITTSLVLILINFFVNFPYFNYYIVVGFLSGAILSVFLNRKKTYILNCSIDNGKYKIIYYTSFGIKKDKYLPINSEIDIVVKRFLFEKISLIKFTKSDKVEIFHTIDDKIIHRIKKLIIR